MQLLTESEASKILCCSVAALRRWRREHRGPWFVKLGRLVRYDDRALEAFVLAHTEGGPTPAVAGSGPPAALRLVSKN